MVKVRKKGFSLAEAMITLMIISLILAAVIPVMSRRQLTSDSMWKYASNNSDIFYGEGASQAAVIGSNGVPQSSNGSKLVIVTHADNNGDTIKRSLIDFYQKGSDGIKSIGRIGFDRNAAEGSSTGSTAIGKDSLIKTTTGWNNTAVGFESMAATTLGWANTAIGSRTLKNNKEGDCNTAVGEDALYANTKGSWNIAMGVNALANNGEGRHNISIGVNSLAKTTDKSSNIAIGNEAMAENKGNNSIAIGTSVLRNNEVDFNIGIGNGALSKNSSGWGNTGIGTLTMEQNTIGAENTSLGNQALRNNKTGRQNTAIGHTALIKNEEGTENTAVGYTALYYNKTGSWNTAVGDQSMLINETGRENTAIGSNSLWQMKIGNYNTSIGTHSCHNIVTGSHNVCIGNRAGFGGTDVNFQLFIEGRGDVYNGANSLIWGDFNSRQVKINGYLYTLTGTISGSDAKLKNIGKEYKTGLEQILKVKVKDFTYKDDKTKRLHHGVIAQELQKIMPDAVVKGPQDLLYVDANEIIFTLVNAVKQLHIKITNNYSEIKILKNKIDILENKNKALETKTDKLEKRLMILEKNLSK